MAFLYSVIGDNTPENREWLEKIGYVGEIDYNTNEVVIYSYVNMSRDSKFSSCNQSEVVELDPFDNDIDCRNNTQLFKAVSAMRDDSDYMQLFKCDGGYFISLYNDANTHIQDYCKGWDMSNLKKMSLSELQEHFRRV